MEITQVIVPAARTSYSSPTPLYGRQSDQFIALLLALSRLDILAETYKQLHAIWRGLTDEGMYEVLEHESTLELLDGQGLLENQCSPGVVVDQHRLGQKAYTVISLHESTRRGDQPDHTHRRFQMT